jgi:integrase
VSGLSDHPDGTRIRSVRTAFTNACQRAKLAGVYSHTLRHTVASRLGMTGVNDGGLQALGRRKEPKIIQRDAHRSQQPPSGSRGANWFGFPYRIHYKKFHSL